MTSDLDALLLAIDALEADDAELESEDEDTFPWTDAARWSPAVVAADDPYGDPLPAFDDDGCVMVTDAARPWVVRVYEPPWWSAE